MELLSKTAYVNNDRNEHATNKPDKRTLMTEITNGETFSYYGTNLVPHLHPIRFIER